MTNLSSSLVWCIAFTDALRDEDRLPQDLGKQCEFVLPTQLKSSGAFHTQAGSPQHSFRSQSALEMLEYINPYSVLHISLMLFFFFKAVLRKQLQVRNLQKNTYLRVYQAFVKSLKSQWHAAGMSTLKSVLTYCHCGPSECFVLF